MANNRQQPLVFDSTKVIADVTYMPTLITRANLDDEVVDPSGSNAARSDGGDIRIYFSNDQTDEMAVEIVGFEHDSVSAADDAEIEIWTSQTDFVNSSVSDTTIYIEYGDGALTEYGVTDTHGRDNVWSDYAFVTHHGLIDSTGNGTITDNGTVSSSGPFGSSTGARRGDSTNADSLTSSQTFSTIVEPFTIQAWGFIEVSQATRIICLADASSTNQQAAIGTLFSSGFGGEIQAWDGTTNDVSSISALTGEDIWRSYSGIFTSDTSRKLNINGGAASVSSTVSVSMTGVDRLKMLVSADSTPFGTQPLRVAEGRFRLSAISDDLDATEFNNQNSPSTFAAAGTPVEIGGVDVSMLLFNRSIANYQGMRQ